MMVLDHTGFRTIFKDSLCLLTGIILTKQLSSTYTKCSIHRNIQISYNWYFDVEIA